MARSVLLLPEPFSPSSTLQGRPVWAVVGSGLGRVTSSPAGMVISARSMAWKLDDGGLCDRCRARDDVLSRAAVRARGAGAEPCGVARRAVGILGRCLPPAAPPPRAARAAASCRRAPGRSRRRTATPAGRGRRDTCYRGRSITSGWRSRGGALHLLRHPVRGPARTGSGAPGGRHRRAGIALPGGGVRPQKPPSPDHLADDRRSRSDQVSKAFKSRRRIVSRPRRGLVGEPAAGRFAGPGA